VRGWDKNLPSRVLHALPKRSWLKRLRRLGLEEIIFSLKHYWRFVDCEALALKALSQGVVEKAA
jgi:hypothetical protein